MKHLLIILTLLLAGRSTEAQYAQAIAVLHAITMTTNAGGSVNQNYWIQDLPGEVSQTVNFTAAGDYRFDFTGHGTKQNTTWSTLDIKIDNTIFKTISINSSQPGVWSTVINIPTTGNHTVAMSFSNETSNTANSFKLYMALLYITPGSVAGPVVYPAIVKQNLPVFHKGFLNSNHFASGVLRGFTFNRQNPNPSPDADILAAKAYGANLIRIFVQLHNNGTNYSILAADLTMADHFLHMAFLNKFYVNICVTEDNQNESYWGSTALKASFVTCIGQVAARYKDSMEVACIAMSNEPGMVGHVGEFAFFAQQMANAIRTNDPNHVIIMPAGVGSQDIYRLTEPIPFSNVVYEVHHYSAFEITHQGEPKNLSDNVRTRYPNVSTESFYNSGLGLWDLNAMIADLKIHVDFATAYNIPLYVGEFSCTPWAPDWSACRFITDAISLYEQYGWSWTLHSFRQYQGWDHEIPPSRWYTYTFVNAAPQVSGGYGTLTQYRTDTTCVMGVCQQYFLLNPDPQETTTEPLNPVDVAKARGVWGYSALAATTDIKQFRPYGIKGIHLVLNWKDIQTAQTTYNWSVLDTKLQTLKDSGLLAGIVIITGQNAPGWVKTACGSFTTTGGATSGSYPDYHNAQYSTFYLAFQQALADHINVLSNGLKNVLAYYQVAEGYDGDDVPYSGTAVSPFSWTTTAWDTQKKTWWDAIAGYQSENSAFLKLMFNPGDGKNTAYCISRFPGSLNKDLFLSQQYNFNGESPYLPRIVNLSRSEGRNFWLASGFRHRRETFSLICSAISGGLGMFDVTPEYIAQNHETTESVADPALTNLLNEFSQQQSNNDPVKAMCYLRAPISQDSTYFDPAIYGAVIDPAQLTAYNNAVATINAAGYDFDYRDYQIALANAQYANPARLSALRTAFPDFSYSTTSSYLNDFGSSLVNNYELNMHQVNARTTSYGTHRVAEATDANSMYGRDGKGFIMTGGVGEMFFDVSSNLQGGLNTVKLEITYLDSGFGTWNVYCYRCNKATVTPSITNQNTLKTKTVTLTIPQFRFDNRINGGDFSIQTSADFPLEFIKITNTTKTQGALP
jgi:endoglucanase